MPKCLWCGERTKNIYMHLYTHIHRRVCDFVKPEVRENEIINSAENTSDIQEKHDKGNINNIAT